MLDLQDGTRLYYKDWGQGAPVVFAQGWSLNGDMWENQMMFLGSQGYRVIACAETDYRDDIGRFDVPVLVIHGERDAFVPFDATARQAAALFPDATLKVYPGAPHGILLTHKDQLNQGLLQFLTR
ncbi:hypothetical protein GCM10009075_31780 [Sphingomonas trueperi]